MIWGLVVSIAGAVGLTALFALLFARSERKRGKANARVEAGKENERRNAAAGDAQRDVDRLSPSGVRSGLRDYIRNGE